MDLLAQKRVLFILTVTFFVTAHALADNGFYRLTQIDYFALRSVEKKKDVLAPLWREQDQVPEEVMALLNEPNEQTARAYLDWNRARMAKIAQAQAMIDAVISLERKP